MTTSCRQWVCRFFLSLTSICLLVTCGGCRSPLPTVDGPETKDLVNGVNGYLVMDGGDDKETLPEGFIVAVSLPSLKQHVVIKAPPRNTDDIPNLRALAGPDSEGRIAFVEDHYMVWGAKKPRHLLKTIKLNGTEEQELFVRPKSALWNSVIGHHLALSPTGGRVAFVSNYIGAQMYDPPALLGVGPVEIWDVSKKTGRKAGVTALDDEISWFPDGKRLAYVELVPWSEEVIPWREAEAYFAKLGGFGSRFKNWEKFPAVHVLDTDTGKKTLLHVGWRPRVSSDGKTVLVSDFEASQSRLVDVASGKSEAADWRGKQDSGLVLLDARRVLYWGLPTTGSPARYGPSGHQLVPLKLAEINSDKFQTLLPYAESGYRAVSFGMGKKKQ